MSVLLLSMALMVATGVEGSRPPVLSQTPLPMPTTALVLALCAAFVHAGWYLLLSRARDSEAATAVALAAGALAFAPVAAAPWELVAEAPPCAAGAAGAGLGCVGMLALG